MAIIDLVNPLDFEGADALRAKAEMIAKPISELRSAMKKAGAPVVFVNDNFGEWHSEKSKLVERAAAKAPGLMKLLAPADDDYFVIKPQFSGFYSTNLPLLLPKLGVSRIILTGIATDICVLFTASDAHMRDYTLWIPEDAVAAESDILGAAALEMMKKHLGAETASTATLTFIEWTRQLDKQGIR